MHRFHFKVCENGKQKRGREPMPELFVDADRLSDAMKEVRKRFPKGSIRRNGWERDGGRS